MRARLLVACALSFCTLGLTGCERLLSIHDPIAGGGDGGIDAMIDSGPPAASPILLSEIVLTPDPGEMIEIVNPSDQDVDISDYYLSDSGNYYKLPFDKTVDMTDFIVKFPPSAVIRGHAAITIAIDMPTNFLNTYSVLPTYSLRDGSMTTIAMNGTPNLTNGGEPIFLFRWDGRSDLVQDIDMLLAGAPSGANPFPNKSSITQDGPDAGDTPSQYAVDVHTIAAQAAAPGGGLSTKRIALEDGVELHNGNSNGPSGDDETSENTAMTWDDGGTAHPFTAPTPGTVPSQLMR